MVKKAPLSFRRIRCSIRAATSGAAIRTHRGVTIGRSSTIISNGMRCSKHAFEMKSRGVWRMRKTARDQGHCVALRCGLSATVPKRLRLVNSMSCVRVVCAVNKMCHTLMTRKVVCEQHTRLSPSTPLRADYTLLITIH
jgi:hypothetical protein